MKFRNIITAFLVAAGTLFTTSCQQEVDTVPEQVEAGYSRVEVKVCDVKLVTKSTALPNPDDDDNIKNLNIFFFNDKNVLVTKKYTTATLGLSFTLKTGEYTVFAVANVGDITEQVTSLESYKELLLQTSNAQVSEMGLPMSAASGVKFEKLNEKLTLDMERLYAKYVFKVDRSNLSQGMEFTVKSVELKGAASRVSPFKPYAVSSTAVLADGDRSSEGDVVNLNSGNSVIFYVPENRQGTEPGITSAKKKIPGDWYSTINTATCTYLEVKGSFRDKEYKVYDVTYRMYLGTNNTNDFNISRNTEYNITFCPQDLNPENDWWKCEPVLEYDYELVLEPSPLTVEKGLTASLVAKYNTYHYGEKVSSEDITQSNEVIWKSSNNSIVSVIKGQVKGLLLGDALLSAEYGHRKASVNVSVIPEIPRLASLAVTPSDLDVNVGSSTAFTVTAHYTTGATRIVTADATFASLDESVAIMENNYVVALKQGSTTIVVSYEEDGITKSQNVNIDVANLVEHSIELVYNEQAYNDFKVGDVLSIDAYYYTITNGVKNEGVKITNAEGVKWAIQTGTGIVEKVGNGQFKANGVGNATIKVEFDDVTKTLPLTVKSSTYYVLEITPATASVKVGSNVSFTATYYKVTNGVKDNGQNVTSKSSCSWSVSEGSSYASATTTKGQFRGNAAGTATVKATYNNVEGTASLTVNDDITHSLVLTPGKTNLTVGETTTVTATYYTITNGVSDGGKTVNVTLSTSNPSVASVSGTTVTAKAQGSANITATYAGVNGSVTISVGNAVYYTLEISPSSRSINVGDNASFTARYYTWTNGVKNSGQDVTSSANWSVSAGASYASATTTKGQFRGNAVGTATVKATYSGEQATATLSVEKPFEKQGTEVKSYGAVTFTVDSIDDIPASGGGNDAPTVSNVKQTVTTREVWSNGATTEYRNEQTGQVNLSASEYSVKYSKTASSWGTTETYYRYTGNSLGTTLKARTKLGDVHVQVTGRGSRSATGSSSVYQQANEVVDSDNGYTVYDFDAYLSHSTAPHTGSNYTYVNVTRYYEKVYSDKLYYTSGSTSGGSVVKNQSHDGPFLPDAVSISPANSGATVGSKDGANRYIDVSANTGSSDRSWTITMSYKGVEKQKTLTQTGKPAATVTSVTVSLSSSSVEIGGNVDYKVYANYSDGTQKDITNDSNMNISFSLNDVVSVQKASNKNYLSSLNVGSTSVIATYDGKQGSSTLDVNPKLIIDSPLGVDKHTTITVITTTDASTSLATQNVNLELKFQDISGDEVGNSTRGMYNVNGVIVNGIMTKSFIPSNNVNGYVIELPNNQYNDKYRVTATVSRNTYSKDVIAEWEEPIRDIRLSIYVNVDELGQMYYSYEGIRLKSFKGESKVAMSVRWMDNVDERINYKKYDVYYGIFTWAGSWCDFQKGGSGIKDTFTWTDKTNALKNATVYGWSTELCVDRFDKHILDKKYGSGSSSITQSMISEINDTGDWKTSDIDLLTTYDVMPIPDWIGYDVKFYGEGFRSETNIRFDVYFFSKDSAFLGDMGYNNGFYHKWKWYKKRSETSYKTKSYSHVLISEPSWSLHFIINGRSATHSNAYYMDDLILNTL